MNPWEVHHGSADKLFINFKENFFCLLRAESAMQIKSSFSANVPDSKMSGTEYRCTERGSVMMNTYTFS